MINWKCGGIEIEIPLPNNKNITNFGGYGFIIFALHILYLKITH